MSNVLASLIVKIGADIKDYSDGLKQATSQLAQIGREMQDAGRTLTAGITLPIVGLGAAAVETAGKFEQTQIAFTHFLGSVQAARGFLGDLYNFAATTPFQINDVTQGAQALMAMGFAAKDIIPDLRILGDQLSAVGRTENMQQIILAFGEMKAKGVASMKEIRQMVTDGVIPAVRYLAEGLGKSETEIFDLLRKKAIDSGTAIKLIMAGMQKDTGGMMQEQMGSFNGQMSNLKDQVTLALKDIGDALLPLAKQFVSLSAGALASVKSMVQAFTELPVPVQDGIIAVAGLAAALGPALLALGLFASAARSIMAVWPVVMTGLDYAAAAFAAIASPIGIAVAAVAAVVAGLYIFRDTTFSLKGATYELRDIWNAAWILMGKAVDGVVSFFVGAASMIRSVWQSVTSWMSSIWGNAFGVIGDTMKATVISLLSWAKSVLGNLVPDFIIKALDEAKKKREDAAKALAAQDAAAAKAAADQAAAAAKKKAELEAEIETLKHLGDQSASTMLAANARFTEFWTAADQAAFAMRQLAQITANAVNEPFRKFARFFQEFAASEPEFSDQSMKAAEAVGAIGEAMDPLADVMSAVTADMNKLSDAFSVLGVKSSAMLQKEADEALVAYDTIRASGIATAHDLQEAWVAMEKARQAAAIAAGQAISKSEKRELENAQRDLGQHVKTMRSDWTNAVNSIRQTIEGGLSRALSDVIFHVGSIGDAFKRLGQDVVSIILDYIIKAGIEALIAKLFVQKAATSAIDVGEVMSYAAVAAAAAFASTAAIPIVGPLLAPAAAAAAYAGTAAYAPLASFDKGGFIPEDMIAMVHKGEYVLTADQVAGRKPLPPAARTNDGGSVSVTIHVNGDRNPRETARQLMQHLKALSPKFSPAS